MPDGEIPPIQITLSVDATNAAQGVADFVKEAKVQIEKGYTDAMDKAQKKLDDLNRSQKVHQEVIAETGSKIEELSKKKQTASAADQANIDQEIKKLQALISTRQLDLNSIEAKKLKVEEQGLLSLSTNAAERQALQQVTQGRLVELGALRDQMRAIAGVRDTSAATAAQIKADLSDMSRKQVELNQVIGAHEQRIMALQRQSEGASASEKDRIEQEIAGLTKAIQSRGAEVYEIDAKKTKLEELAALMTATSDEERQKIQETTQARLAEISTIQDSNKVQAGVRDSHSAMTAEAKAEIDSLTRKQQIYGQTIEADKKRIDELKAKKAAASDEARKQIDQEINSLQKIVVNRQQDSLEIEAKKIKLEESIALSTAGSEYERQAIQKATAERLIENNVIKDQQKAQAAVNTEVEQGSNAVSNYIASFGGLAGVLIMVRTLTNAMQGQRDEMEKMFAVGQKIRDMQTGEIGKMAGFFDEAELYDPASQDAGKQMIEGIANDNNLKVDVVAQTAADLAPTLSLHGIRPDRDQGRFKDIVGNVARFKNRGLDTGMMSNFMGNFLKEHPQSTGADVNQELSNIMAQTGSAKRANALMQVYNEQQTKFEGVKFSYDDVKQVYEAMRTNNVSPEGIPTAAKQFFQSMDRLVGLSPDEKDQKVQELEDRGLGKLDHFFETDKPVDIRGLAAAIDTLPKAQQEMASRLIGGPRNVVAALAANSWSQTYRSHNDINFPLMPAPSNPMEIADAQKEQADIALQNTEEADPGKTQFSAVVKTKLDDLAHNPHNLPWYQRRFFGVLNSTPITTNAAENSAISAYGQLLMRQARLLRDIDSGKVKALPDQRQALLASMSELRNRIDPLKTTGDGINFDKSHDIGGAQDEDLGNLIRGGGYTAKVLGTLEEHGISDDQFIQNSASHVLRNSDLEDDRIAAPIYNRANRVYNDVTGQHIPVAPAPAPAKSTTRPSTQPSTSPVSINYNIRQHNYGYSYDSLGTTDGLPNLYG